MTTEDVLQKLKQKNIAIVTHTRAVGLPQLLHNWLIDKTNNLIYIDHALHPSRDTKSNLIVHKKGKGKINKSYKSWISNKPGGYVKDFFFTIWIFLRYKQTADIGVGANNLNTLSLLVLRKLGRVKFVVFHTVDYTPNRFSNKIANYIYHWIDRYCCEHADLLWNSSARMNEGRKKYGVKDIARTIITPDGSNFDEKERLPLAKIDRNLVIFLGHLRQGMGLPMIIKAFVRVIKNYTQARLLIIGGGPLQKELEDLVRKKGLARFVTFTGFIKDHHDVDILLSRGAVSLATFEDSKDSIEYYSDVGKPKAYLAAGLPVIITRVPEIATEIEKKNAGVVVGYNEEEISKAIVKLLSNKKEYEKYRENAISLSKKYRWPEIFTNAFKESFILIEN